MILLSTKNKPITERGWLNWWQSLDEWFENHIRMRGVSYIGSSLRYAVFALVISIMIVHRVQAQGVFEYFAGTVNVADATVQINGTETKTDSNGAFGFHVAQASRYVINVTKPGYALVSQIEIIPNINLNFTLKEVEVYPIDPSQPSEVEDSRGTQIKLPANALVDSYGNLPTGSINLMIHTYDLANEEMPGDMGGINTAGEEVFMESAGAFWAEFTDASGKKYNLASNQEASISIPRPKVENEEPPTLWSYKESTGQWIEEESVVNLENGRLEGKVGHFTAWNFDWEKKNPACVKLEIDQSVFSAYANNGQLQIKAVAGGGQRIRYLTVTSSGPHVLYNLLPYTTVNFYVPSPLYNIPIGSINAGARWGNKYIPPYPYDVCNGKITLTNNSVELVAVPNPPAVCSGTSFDVTIQAMITGSQPVDTASIYLNFDPAVLQVNSLTNSGILDFELSNNYDNTTGSISFEAGAWDTAPTQTFDIFTINFTALQSQNTVLTFDSTQSALGNQGQPVNFLADNQPLTSDCLLNYQVDLARKNPKPHTSWQTPLEISVGDTSVYQTYTHTSDNKGEGFLLLNSPLENSDYICVKNTHTLANKIAAPITPNSSDLVELGLLLEGDVNSDNSLSINDLSLMYASKNTCDGDQNYDSNADLNGDDCVNIDDANLLKNNWGQTSACSRNISDNTLRRGIQRSGAGGAVTLSTTVIPTGLKVGDAFDYTIDVQAGTQLVDVVSAYLNFDPTQLQVNQLTAGDLFDFVLQQDFDNTNGLINFAAGVWNNKVPTGTFTLVTVNMTILQLGGEKTLSFNTIEPRQTEVASGGQSVISEQQGTKVVFDDEITIAPASCRIYAVNDEGLNNSQFFTVILDDLQVEKLGPLYEGYDIESLAIHPETNMIYAASGDNVTNGKKGFFYRVDGQTGELFPLRSTGFDEIEDLAFSPDGTLYAWAKGDGLITIDSIGQGTLVIPYDQPLIEGLTLKKDENNIFFGAVGTDLWQYDNNDNTLEIICPNGLLGETEALEVTSDGLLLIGTHQVPFGLHAFDVQNCQIILAPEDLSHEFNDVEGIALPVKDCSFP